MLTKKFKNEINEIFKKDSENIEIEVRFGYFSNGNYTNRINEKTFQSVKNYLDKKYKSEEINTIDFLKDNIRKTVNNENVSWIIKENIFNEINIRNGLNYSINKEIPIKEVQNFSPDIIRQKKRLSYKIYPNSINIDITEVILDNNKFYEIEAELHNSEQIKLFENIIYEIFKFVINGKKYN